VSTKSGQIQFFTQFFTVDFTSFFTLSQGPETLREKARE